MTDNNGKDANEVNAEKGENIVIVDKNGAEELKKVKNNLNSKKTWATRDLNTFNKRAQAFKDSSAKHNRDNTQATRVHLQKRAEDVLVSESKHKKHQEDLEKLAEEIKESLDQHPVSGANAEEVTTKLETELFD